MAIPHVIKGRLISTDEQNALIDQVNTNTEDIEGLGVPGGDLELVQELIDESVTAHEVDTTPHPAYDDLPSLRLLFENGLV